MCIDFDLESSGLIEQCEALNQTTPINTQSLDMDVNQDDLGNVRLVSLYGLVRLFS